MRTVLHSDINSCFASIELSQRPGLRERPVAVCGSQEERHGIVLAKNQIAKGFGVRTGQVIWQARQLCPELVVLPPNYPLYERFCGYVRELYGEYTDLIEPFGIDECWLDTSGSASLFGDGEKIAQEIRTRVKSELGITVSLGVSWNKVFAKLGSDMKKPDAVTAVSKQTYREQVWPLPVGELLYVGPSTARRLERYNIFTIGQLATAEPDFLRRLLGKAGESLFAFANGYDAAPVSAAGAEPIIKSIGNGTTPPRDIENEADAALILMLLSDSVASRLRDGGFLCRGVQLFARDSSLACFERQAPLDLPSALSRELRDAALALLRRSYGWKLPLRSIGVRAIDLIPSSAPVQFRLDADEEHRARRERLERAADGVRSMFGGGSVRCASALLDRSFTGIRIGEQPHPAAPQG